MNAFAFRHRQGQPDLLAVTLAIILAVAGLAIAGSAGVYAETLSGAVPTGMQRSFTHLLVGLAVMLLAMVPDYHLLAHRWILWWMLASTTLTLAATLFGPEIKGTHRWLMVGGIQLQPSEFAKPVLVLAVSATLAKAVEGGRVRSFDGLARPMLIAAMIAGLVLLGKDLGTPTLLFGTTLALVFAAGARLLHLGALLAAGLPLFFLFTQVETYRLERLAAFASSLHFTPQTLREIPWQLRQSIVAIGSGGLFGKGFGASSQKALFLPEANNDFIFAIIGEELGMLGALLVLAAFMLIAWRGVAAYQRAPDEFGRLIAMGVTVLLCGQALCHMGVVTGILPTKGLPLPFLSSGGSSMISSFALIGLLLNVSLRGRSHLGEEALT